MTKEKVFSYYSPFDLKILEKKSKDVSDFLGYVYAVDFGGNVKIGSTHTPYKRYKQLEMCANYARVEIGCKILLTPAHTNFRENEKKVHAYFDNVRVNRTELFNTTLDEVEANISLRFEDTSKEDEEKAKKMAKEFVKQIYGNRIIEEDLRLEELKKKLLFIQLAGECSVGSFYTASVYNLYCRDFKLPYIPCDEKELSELLELFGIYEEEEVEKFVNFILSRGFAEKDSFGSIMVKNDYFGYNLEKTNGEHNAVWFSYTFGLIMAEYFYFIN